MHEGRRQDSFASAVTQVDEGAAWLVKSPVPATARFFVALGDLDPPENLEQTLRCHLAVSQVDLLQFFRAALHSALGLHENKSVKASFCRERRDQPRL